MSRAAYIEPSVVTTSTVNQDVVERRPVLVAPGAVYSGGGYRYGYQWRVRPAVTLTVVIVLFILFILLGCFVSVWFFHVIGFLLFFLILSVIA